MERITPDTEARLLDYIDGVLNEKSKQRMEEEIKNSPALKLRLDELKAIHQAMKSHSRVEVPSLNFTQRVMSGLDSYKAISGISPRNGIILLGGIIVAVVISLLLLNAGMFNSLNGSIQLENLPVENTWKDSLPTINLNGKVFMKAVLLLITGLSFVLLDRTILRPIFNKRISH